MLPMICNQLATTSPKQCAARAFLQTPNVVIQEIQVQGKICTQRLVYTHMHASVVVVEETTYLGPAYYYCIITVLVLY